MDNKVTSNACARAKHTKPRITRSEELLETIFERVASGESLNRICSEPDMPTRKSFFEWVAEDVTVLRRYEFAMIMRADVYAEQTIEIADDSTQDRREDENGRLIVDHEVVNRSRIRVDARKWYASKLAPKKYGDKIENVHSGDSANPIQKHITISFKPGIPDK